MFKGACNLQFILALGAILAATAIICVCAATCTAENLSFEASFYFVCYRTEDNAVSAGALSDSAYNMGGAGYVLHLDGSYYVTLSCYYSEDEARSVCANLKANGLDCTVKHAKSAAFKLSTGNARRNRELFSGNLNTLNSLTNIAYDCANGLDTGMYTQSDAKRILASISDTLNGLLKANGNNCFTEGIKSLAAECKSAGYGYLFSKDMRYIQIAIADKIINAKLY